MFSPDMRWMAYTSDESGAPEVYVRRFPGAEGFGVYREMAVRSPHGAATGGSCSISPPTAS
jgi:hypothetical protein